MPIYSNANPMSLESLTHYLRDLETSLVSAIAEESKPAIEQLIEEQFASGHDPEGRAWAPLKPATIDKGRTPPPLTDTGTMRDSVEVRATSQGLFIRVDWPAHFHQYGTARMAARPILPEASLPVAWHQAIDDAAKRVVRGRNGSGGGMGGGT